MKKSFILILMSVLLLASCSLFVDDGTRSCTVNHYLENLEDDEYTLNSKLTQKFKGKLNEETAVEALSLEGFIPQDFEQIVIGEKNNVISIYYKRTVATVTFNGNGGSLTGTNEEGKEEQLEQIVITGKYGLPIEEPVFTRKCFTWNGWDKDFPEFIPASDMELTGFWTAEITNSTNRYYVRPLQKFTNTSGAILNNNRLCWDYFHGLTQGYQIIIWTQKDPTSVASVNQFFYFEPVEGKENTYFIFSKTSNDVVYYLEENIKTYSKSSTVTVDGLCAGSNKKTPNSLQFELISVKSPEKPNDEVFAIKIAGTNRYVTTGYSFYKYDTKPSYIAGYGDYESCLILDTLRTNGNDDIDVTQLFYLDNVDK